MTYRAPINDMLLALNHGAGLKAAVEAGHYGDFDADIAAAVLEEAGKFATDVLAVGTSSNIGAYGVVAAIALLKGDPALCHTPEEEEALHHVGVGLGLVDGGGGDRIAWCDGIPADANAALVRLMRNIVERTLEAPRVRTF